MGTAFRSDAVSCVCAAQHDSHLPRAHWALETWLVDTEKLQFKISLILMNLNSHMWPVSPVFDSLVQAKCQLFLIL